MSGENCATSCRTKDHDSWGECVRSQNHKVAYCQEWKGNDATRQRKWDRELAEYREAKQYGLQPNGTSTAKVREAVAAVENRPSQSLSA